MSGWKNCVVSLIDLVETKKIARRRRGQASSLMRKTDAEVARRWAEECRFTHTHTFGMTASSSWLFSSEAAPAGADWPPIQRQTF